MNQVFHVFQILFPFTRGNIVFTLSDLSTEIPFHMEKAEL